MNEESLGEGHKDPVPGLLPLARPARHQHEGGHGQQQLECFSDEVDSRGSAERKKASGPVAGGGGDGASIEVAKRRRGRPPGSKNKPKPPVVITREAEPEAAMRPHVLEIPRGRDVADALARFARLRNIGICVLAGTGAVATVSLRHPSPAAAAAAGAIVFHGQYEILSMSATFLPPSMSAVAPHAAAAAGVLSITLAGPHGQIVGGAVAGPLFAATTVVVLAAAFANPIFHRLSPEDDASVSVSGSGDADDQQGHHHPHQPEPHVAAPHPPPADSCGVSMYACHSQPQEVIWAPMARTPHPPPY